MKFTDSIDFHFRRYTSKSGLYFAKSKTAVEGEKSEIAFQEKLNYYHRLWNEESARRRQVFDALLEIYSAKILEVELEKFDLTGLIFLY